MTPNEIDNEVMNDPGMQKLAQDDPTAFDEEVARLYHSYGYDKYGAPLSLVKRGIGKISRSTGIPEVGLEMAAATPIPLVTTLVGAMGGNVPGAMAGSLMGEEINAQLGITDPMTTTDRVVAAGAPLVGPLASRAKGKLSGAAKFLPGGAFGMNELAIEAAERVRKGLRVDRPHVDAAYGMIRHADNFSIDMPNMKALFATELKKKHGSTKFEIPGAKSYETQLLNVYNKLVTNKKMSLREMDSIAQDFRTLKEANPSELWGRAQAAMIQDLEAATMNPNLTQSTRDKALRGLNAFKNAIQVSNKYHATQELDAIFKRTISPVTNDPNLHVFNKKVFIKNLENNDNLKDGFSADEIQQLHDAVENLGYIGTPPSGMNTGIPYVGRSGPFAALGWGLGTAVGLVPTQAALIGYTTQEVLTNALATQTGRNVVKYLATTGKGKINMLELQSIMGKVLAGTMAGGAAALKAPTEGAMNAFPMQE